MMKRHILLIFLSLLLGRVGVGFLSAQTPVPVGTGSYASFVPLSKSRTSEHGGCQAYQMEHRRLYLPDSLLARLGTPDGSQQGSLALPTNDWWTHALVNTWTGKLWFYPGWAEAKDGELTIGYPSYWEPTGCEVKWDTPLTVTFTNTATGKKANFQEALVDSWSDFAMSFIMQDGEAWVRVTCMEGSPLVWLEASDTGCEPRRSALCRFYGHRQNDCRLADPRIRCCGLRTLCFPNSAEDYFFIRL